MAVASIDFLSFLSKTKNRGAPPPPVRRAEFPKNGIVFQVDYPIDFLFLRSEKNT
jgi:hypothetical protein